MSHDHDICGECGRPVEPARHGGQRRKGKDGLRRCVACQARRVARGRPVRQPRDACDDCGTAIGTERERRHMWCADGGQRCTPCYLEYRRAKQRKTPPPDRQPGQNPPCGECGEVMADGWARRIGRDGVYRCRACSYQRALVANRGRSRLAHRRQRAREKAARAEGAGTIQREGIVKRIIRGLITGAVLALATPPASACDGWDACDAEVRRYVMEPCVEAWAAHRGVGVEVLRAGKEAVIQHISEDIAFTVEGIPTLERMSMYASFREICINPR